MRFFNGAGGVAAAILLLSFGIVNPTPSRAWEMNTPNVTPATLAPALTATPAVETVPPTPTTAAPAAEPAPVAAEPAPQPRVIEAPRRSLAQAVEAFAAGAVSDAEQD